MAEQLTFEYEEVDGVKYYVKDATARNAIGNTSSLPDSSKSVAENIATINTSVTTLNNNLSDLTMLGWEVPKECPIQNSVSGNTFTQKVGRIDLGTLTWGNAETEGKAYFYSSYLQPYAKRPSSATEKANIYVYKYTNGIYRDVYQDSKDDIVWLYTNGNLCLRDTTYSTIDAFKSAMRGVYLYYELATPITKTIDGNEDNSSIKSDLSDLQMLGYEIPKSFSPHNSATETTFTQKSARLCLGDLTWTKQAVSEYSSYQFYSSVIPNITLPTNNSTPANIYCYEYKTTSVPKTVLFASDNNIGLDTNGKLWLHSEAIASKTIDEVQSLLKNVYLYYQLLTPITKKIDGNEDNSQIKKSLSDNEERGYLENILADNNNLVLGAIAQNNPQSYTSSTNRLVTKDLITLKPNTDYRIRFTGANARFFIIGWTSSSATSATYNSSWQTTDGFTFNSGSCTCCRIGFGKTDDSAITVSNVSKFGFAEYVPSNSEIKTALSPSLNTLTGTSAITSYNRLLCYKIGELKVLNIEAKVSLTQNSYTTIATLPTDCFPIKYMVIKVIGIDITNKAYLRISTDGTVALYTTASSFNSGVYINEAFI